MMGGHTTMASGHTTMTGGCATIAGGCTTTVGDCTTIVSGHTTMYTDLRQCAPPRQVFGLSGTFFFRCLILFEVLSFVSLFCLL